MQNLLHDLKQFLKGLFKVKDSYNITVTIYNTSQWVAVQKGCSGIMFTNVGADPVEVNGMICYPGTIGSVLGDSRSIGNHKNDVYKGNLSVKFAGTGTNPAVEIVQVFYTDEQ